MKVIGLRLLGLKLITPKIFSDERGFFYESYQQAHCKIAPPFVQDNISFSKKNTIRGLHYQVGQAKLVSCLQGKILDIAVDIRPESSTFGQWESVELGDCNHQQLLVPDGFAHGFCVLSETALVHYKVSSVYQPDKEGSLRWNDPQINVHWPIENPILSLRDKKSPFFKEVFR